MKSPVDKLLKQHHALNQSDGQKVLSHVQRDIKRGGADWVLNTLMIEGCDVPFKFKRKQAVRSLQGQRVNLTYYRSVEDVAGITMEIMKVVRIKIA